MGMSIVRVHGVIESRGYPILSLNSRLESIVNRIVRISDLIQHLALVLVRETRVPGRVVEDLESLVRRSRVVRRERSLLDKFQC